MTNAFFQARKMALGVLKAYHLEIKSGFVTDCSAVEREKAQAAAFAEAERQIRESAKGNKTLEKWLDATSKDDI